jgi:hypothetical protein
MLSTVINILLWYLIIGLVCGLAWPIHVIVSEMITGRYDPKFGPAWRSSMTYIISASMMIPMINLVWVVVIKVMVEDYVRSRKKQG